MTALISIIKNIAKRLFSFSDNRKLLFIGALLFVSCENDIEKVNLVTKRSHEPVETGMGLEILYSDSAQIKVKITTPELNRYQTPTPHTELPKGVHVYFYNDKMEVTSTLTSKYALRKEDEKIMEAKKDVVVVNSKGEKLLTERLTWDEKTGKLYSNEFVKIITADEIIMGNGFESNQDFSRYKIFDIKGTINLRNDANVKNP